MNIAITTHQAKIPSGPNSNFLHSFTAPMARVLRDSERSGHALHQVENGMKKLVVKCGFEALHHCHGSDFA